MKVGFIGIGIMGGNMARHVLEAGYDLQVNDIRKEAAQPLLDKGATWQDTPKAMAQASEVVLTSLPGPPEVEEVTFGKDGLSSGWKKGDIYIDTSTNSPTAIARIAEKAGEMGVTVLDAPVTGGVGGAEQGKLNFLDGSGDKSGVKSGMG